MEEAGDRRSITLQAALFPDAPAQRDRVGEPAGGKLALDDPSALRLAEAVGRKAGHKGGAQALRTSTSAA